MDEETKQKIEKYVANAFTAAQQKANQAAQDELGRVRANLASRGMAISSAMDYEIVRIESEKINTLLKVRGNALLDAYEIYNEPFDENAILQDVQGIRATLIASITSGARSQDVLRAVRTGTHDSAVDMRYEEFKRRLTINSQPISNELICEIEQRKVAPKMRQHGGGVNITYQLRDNARVNINSTDQSVNSVTVTELFTAIREAVALRVPEADQEAILASLDDLQNASGTSSFSDKFTRFMAVAADFMTVLGPFVPALADLAKKTLSG